VGLNELINSELASKDSDSHSNSVNLNHSSQSLNDNNDENGNQEDIREWEEFQSSCNPYDNDALNQLFEHVCKSNSFNYIR